LTQKKNKFFSFFKGNISTSHLPALPQEKGFLFYIEPRYPLFGGWKTEFTIGYNLPAENYLLRDAEDRSRYVLNISFIPNWKTDVVIENLIVKVILPEGAKYITLSFFLTFTFSVSLLSSQVLLFVGYTCQNG
jgi:hypothetical protein